ncbi:MAG TPA: hypothetical protein VFN70_18215 [Burkholderiales bacterium]|nr:hypothetical protein [Burkholderiales bacterium]
MTAYAAKRDAYAARRAAEKAAQQPEPEPMVAPITPEDWDRQAAFMRKHAAVHAEWAEIGGRVVLTRLILGPPPEPPRPAAPAPKPTTGIAKSLLERHNVQFAASRMKPPFEAPKTPESDVPRAVRAKTASAGRGSKKA